MRHKHADFIHAWAEGAEIEYWSDTQNKWKTPVWQPSWNNDDQYRIKPAPKPDKVSYVMIMNNGDREVIAMQAPKPFERYSGGYAHVKIVRDSETNHVKSAEVLK